MPTFPETVLSAGTVSPPGSNGPFQDGTNLFVLGAKNGSPNVVAVFLSTDGGATWAEQDIGNGKNSAAPLFAAAQDPATHSIYVAYFRSSDSTLALSTFNTTTKLWGATITSALTSLNTTLGLSSLFVSLVYRPGSNSVVFAGNVLETPVIKAYRAGYAACAIGGAWDGAFTPCGQTDNSDNTDWVPTGTCLGQTDSIHILYDQFQPIFPFLCTVQQQQLTSGGVLGSLQLIYTTTEIGADPAVLPLPTSIASRTVGGNKEVWVAIGKLTPISGGSTSDSLFVVSGLSAANITFSAPSVIAAQSPVNVLVSGIGLSAGANAVNVFWNFPITLGSSTGSYYFCANTGGGFGTPTLLGSAVNNGSRTSMNAAPLAGSGNPWAISFRGSVFFFALGGVSPVPVVIVTGGGTSSFYFWGVLRFPLLAAGNEPYPYNPDISRAPRISGSQDQNIMAPEWMLGNQCTPETPDGYWDEPFTLASKAVVNAVGTTTVGVEVDVPKDCETFIVRNVQYNSVADNGVTGAATVQIRLPSGYSLTDRDMLPADWTGPLFTVLSIPGGGRIIVDVGDMDAAGVGNITTTVQFDGVKRRKLQ
jgi:hypothetical protein